MTTQKLLAGTAVTTAPVTQLGDDRDQPLDLNQTAAFFDVSVVSIWRMVRDERIPRPFYPRPRAPRWLKGELREARERMRMTPTEAKAAHRASKLQADAAPAT